MIIINFDVTDNEYELAYTYYDLEMHPDLSKQSEIITQLWYEITKKAEELLTKD